MKKIVLGLLALVFVTASAEAANRFDESFDINDPLKNYPGLRKKN